MSSIDFRGKRYRARIHLAGHPVVTKTFDTIEEATLWVNAEEHRVLSLREPKVAKMTRLKNSFSMPDWAKSHQVGCAPPARPDTSTPLLPDALERYALDVSSTKKSEEQELGLIRRWMKNSLSSASLADIRGSHLAQHRDRRLAEGISGSTLQKEFALISHLYKVAQTDWGFEKLANPVRMLRKPKIGRGRNSGLRGDEEARLLAYCDQEQNALLRAVIILAIETAMRRGELTGLMWKDVCLRSRMTYLHDTKNGERRTVLLATRAVAAFQSVPRTSPTSILNVSADRVTSQLIEACRACSIEDLRLHDLRNEATTQRGWSGV